MIVLIIGNFMLLNLFLAILLKSISTPKVEEEDEVDASKKEKEEPKPEEEGQEECGGHDESHVLNSSNSNIEDEFNQIKEQLMQLSKGLQVKINKSQTTNNKKE